jgi:tyrosyl-tRNA synthetase
MDLYRELRWRGLVSDGTEGVEEVLAKEKVTGYIGFDPTAASLHVGNLLVMLALARLQRHGHSPIALVGGGTGLIGDPGGKAAERQLLTREDVEANVAGIRTQLARVLDFETPTNPARLVNNAAWLTEVKAIDFMRDVGKHFTINALLAKESIRRRVDGEGGISYTEFSYVLLQAYDFLELYDRFGCTLQMGGSDQWGNITAGMDLVRRTRGARVYGLVMPLLTTSAGTKFGKTEAGAIWLDPERTSPYEFYQFWLNTDDRDAIPYLKFFTFLGPDEIDELEAVTRREPERRQAQRILAQEVTRLVHGDAALKEAQSSADKLFKGDVRAMSLSELLQVFGSVPSSQVAHRIEGWLAAEFLTSTGVTSSKGEATRLIRNGGIYVNGERLGDEKARLMPADAIQGQYFLIRKGKRDNFLVRVVEEASGQSPA